MRRSKAQQSKIDKCFPKHPTPGGSCEIELGSGNNKVFLKIHFEPLEIWIDTKALGPTGMLCAMCDGTPFLQSQCGSSKRGLLRFFVNIEWAINEWGGETEIVEALKVRKQMIIDDLPRLKEKYGEKSEAQKGTQNQT